MGHVITSRAGYLHSSLWDSSCSVGTSCQAPVLLIWNHSLTFCSSRHRPLAQEYFPGNREQDRRKLSTEIQPAFSAEHYLYVYFKTRKNAFIKLLQLNNNEICYRVGYLGSFQKTTAFLWKFIPLCKIHCCQVANQNSIIWC